MALSHRSRPMLCIFVGECADACGNGPCIESPISFCLEAFPSGCPLSSPSPSACPPGVRIALMPGVVFRLVTPLQLVRALRRDVAPQPLCLTREAGTPPPLTRHRWRNRNSGPTQRLWWIFRTQDPDTVTRGQ